LPQPAFGVLIVGVFTAVAIAGSPCCDHRDSRAIIVEQKLVLLFQTCKSAGVSVLSTCVTKQTKDMRYSTLEPLWFLSFGLTHDDAVCPGKRVVSWISVCSSCRVIKKRRCRYRTCAVSLACPGQPAIAGSTATKRLARKGCSTSAGSRMDAHTQPLRSKRTQSSRFETSTRAGAQGSSEHESKCFSPVSTGRLRVPSAIS
jgi:hypothetical protein